MPKLSSAFSQAAPNGCSSTRGYFLFAQRHPGDIAVPWPGCTTHSPTPAQGLQGSLTGAAPAVHRSPFHCSVRMHSSWKRLFEAPVLNLTNAFHLPPLPKKLPVDIMGCTGMLLSQYRCAQKQVHPGGGPFVFSFGHGVFLFVCFKSCSPQRTGWMGRVSSVLQPIRQHEEVAEKRFCTPFHITGHWSRGNKQGQ